MKTTNDRTAVFLGIWLFFCVQAALFQTSCANRGAPSGGPKDTLAPKLVNSYPETGATNFQEEELVLTFNEWVQANQLNGELIINPPLEEFEIKTRKNEVRIILKDTLEENTTYTFNFNEGVKDITENNPAKNIIIALSTGPQIDSLGMSGQLVDLYTNEPVGNGVIGLYSTNDTLNAFTGKPKYLTRTAEDGSYSLKYLKTDTYRLYGYLDENSNLTIESKDERYGFIGDSITLQPTDTSLSGMDLRLLKRDVRSVSMNSARQSGPYFEMKYNKPLARYTYSILEVYASRHPLDSTKLTSQLADGAETIRFYNTGLPDSMKIRVVAVDSVNQNRLDTVMVKIEDTQRDGDEFETGLVAKQKVVSSDTIEYRVTINKPAAVFSVEKISATIDSIYTFPVKRDWVSINDKQTTFTFIVPVNKKEWLKQVELLKVERDSVKKLEDIKLINSYLDSISNVNKRDSAVKLLSRFNSALFRQPNSIFALRDTVLNTRDFKLVTFPVDSFREVMVGERQKIIGSYENELLDEITLDLDSAAIISIEKDTSKALASTLNFPDPEQYGIVEGKVDSLNSPVIVELTSTDYKTVYKRKFVNPVGNYRFNYVRPGEYRLRVIIDQNGNGRHDKGNVLLKQEPETILFPETSLKVRAGWEYKDQDILFSSTNTRR